MAASGPPLVIWAVSDGRAGIEAQAVGLAEAVARLRVANITIKRVGWKAGLGHLPWPLIPPRAALISDDPITSPWPDIWIAAGRATLPLSTRIHQWSGGQTFVVQTQNPRTNLGAFDMVASPEHDRLSGPNVFPIVGALNRLTKAKLDADLARFAKAIDPLPHPRVAVIIGGKSKAFDLLPNRASALAEEIATTIEAVAGSVMVSFTRRTPAAAREIMSERWARLTGVIWDGTGENPYFAFLAAADTILVTEDSVNLATDGAATGRPVFVLTLAGRGSAKFARFHRDLENRGITRRFAGGLADWTYPMLQETDRAAAEVMRRYDARTSNLNPRPSEPARPDLLTRARKRRCSEIGRSPGHRINLV